MPRLIDLPRIAGGYGLAATPALIRRLSDIWRRARGTVFVVGFSVRGSGPITISLDDPVFFDPYSPDSSGYFDPYMSSDDPPELNLTSNAQLSGVLSIAPEILRSGDTAQGIGILAGQAPGRSPTPLSTPAQLGMLGFAVPAPGPMSDLEALGQVGGAMVSWLTNPNSLAALGRIATNLAKTYDLDRTNDTNPIIFASDPGFTPSAILPVGPDDSVRSGGDDAPGQHVVYFFTSGTWTAPLGITGTIKVECIGGGGSGASYAAGAGYGGGGGGGYGCVQNMEVTPGNDYPYTVGSGGTVGQDGEMSLFTGDEVPCAGFGGLRGDPENQGGGSYAPGTGGSGIGDVVYSGGTGGTGGGEGVFQGGGGGAGASATANGANASGASGASGSGDGGAGGNGAAGSAATAGGNYGGGGGGGHGNEPVHGAGGPGLVRITYVVE